MGSAASSNSTSARGVAESRVIKIASYLRVGTWILLSVTTLAILYTAVALFWSPTLPSGSSLLEGLLSEEEAGIPF